VVEVSALKQEGIEDLEQKIASIILSGRVIKNEEAMISNLRQKESLKNALDFINESLELLSQSIPFGFIAESIKKSIEYLDEITGKRITEDLLDRIFSQFCIGK
jgi:tRNA modification GTPase